MAAIDSDTKEIVVRIAYDGAARAGKTTNILQLSKRLKQEVFTPDQPGHRTVYFDWMKYKGGSFDGMPIRCEIVTVPGQELLRERRQLLLNEADVIVHVADVTQTSLEEISTRIQEIRDPAGFPIPRDVVVQINKCDLEPSVSIKELLELCKGEEPPVLCLEAIASTGRGVQETFVYAVRTALNRVRALRDQGLLPSAEDMSGERLLAWLQKHEAIMDHQNKTMWSPAASSADSAADPSLSPPPIQSRPNKNKTSAGVDDAIPDLTDLLSNEGDGPPANIKIERVPPELPTSHVPQGRVWPPQVGRELLEKLNFEGYSLETAGPNAWFCSIGNNWHIYSGADCLFECEEDGSQVLLNWARFYAGLAPLLSRPRCIVLAPVDRSDGANCYWRLWQITKTHPSFRQEIAYLLDEEDRDSIARKFAEFGAGLLEMEGHRKKFPNLPACTLDRVGHRGTGVQYVGILPRPSAQTASEVEIMDAEALLLREFTEIITSDWRGDKKLLKSMQTLAAESTNYGVKRSAEVLQNLLKTPRTRGRARSTSRRRWGLGH